ncbi:hypothetical protein CFOL_v3_07926 [Cephalotus follicularis]|uniref:Uncharacterized protein n=1 Tax=Cephalotus follicularis TaxID=3775 RepID=A0A1Q3B8U6_CEPFO|nr:hypothetical protein CFOL_v3_07926 [Cephalotus follicularis]
MKRHSSCPFGKVIRIIIPVTIFPLIIHTTAFEATQWITTAISGTSTCLKSTSRAIASIAIIATTTTSNTITPTAAIISSGIPTIARITTIISTRTTITTAIITTIITSSILRGITRLAIWRSIGAPTSLSCIIHPYPAAMKVLG